MSDSSRTEESLFPGKFGAVDIDGVRYSAPAIQVVGGTHRKVYFDGHLLPFFTSGPIRTETIPQMAAVEVTITFIADRYSTEPPEHPERP